jgi:hypothetical protein
MTLYEENIKKWIDAKNPRRILQLLSYDKEELPTLPDEVEWLDLSYSCIPHLKNLPKNLKWLRCKDSCIITVELPLPVNLKYFDARGCENLLLFEVPKGLRFLSDIEKYTREKRYDDESNDDIDDYINHYKYAIKRIEEWKVTNLGEKHKKKHKTPLDLSWLKIEDYSIIPNEVEYLIIGGNSKLKSLYSIPRGLKRLEYEYFPFETLDGLPESLEYLKMKRSEIKIIDKLPNTIKKLIIKENVHSDLVIKGLPSSLKELVLNNSYTYYNIDKPITNIKCDFPLQLRKLYLNCKLINNYIPKFPDSLRYIDLDYTVVSRIEYLPPNLKVLMIDKYLDNNLPLLPDGLLIIHIYDINKLNNNIIPCSIKYINSSQIAFVSNKLRPYSVRIIKGIIS